MGVVLWDSRSRGDVVVVWDADAAEEDERALLARGSRCRS